MIFVSSVFIVICMSLNLILSHSYLTTTFVIETMAAANAVKRMNSDTASNCSRDDNEYADDEQKPLLGDSGRSNYTILNLNMCNQFQCCVIFGNVPQYVVTLFY